jgi:hypothetical protein
MLTEIKKSREVSNYLIGLVFGLFIFNPKALAWGLNLARATLLLPKG